jgi:ATP-binding cassette subfamily A (ABC1) protein 3
MLQLDDDVLAEEERVKNQRKPDVGMKDKEHDPEQNLISVEGHYDVIRVSGLRKAYTKLFAKPFLAVERISFGLDYGECFALLGVNGAGKSTTFKSLTGDVLPTEGEVTIAGFDIYQDFKEARKLIGYCPQKDAIFPLLNVEEHLWFYSRIKGVPPSLREEVVEKAIVEMNLAEHRTKPAGTLSGGNKRKLSVAIATLGNPPIILLDEPSAGMDPEARRFMWSVVERISQRDKRSAVILTTHSMEEAEALSTKMGIMVRGGIFRCFGSSQHIKNKFGTGFEIQLKIRKATYEDLDEIA